MVFAGLPLESANDSAARETPSGSAPLNRPTAESGSANNVSSCAEINLINARCAGSLS